MGNGRSNGVGKYMVEFDIGDLAMMAEAMSLASATAMAYGQEGKRARKRFQELRDMFAELSPIPSGHRSEAYEWYNVCAAVQDAEAFGVHVVEASRSWNDDGRRNLAIHVDGKAFEIAERVAADDIEALVTRIEDSLLEVSGMEVTLLARTPCRVAVDGDYTWDDEKDRQAIRVKLDRLFDPVVNRSLGAARDKIEVREFKRDFETKAVDGRNVYYAVLGVPSDVQQDAERLLKADLERPVRVPSPK